MPIVGAAREVNYRQRARIVEKLRNELKILKGRAIGLLGLSFKPQTDDLRDAPALDLAQRLVDAGAKVRAHDPVAMPGVLALRRVGLELCDSPEGVVRGADAVVLVTEWPEYRALDWSLMAQTMKNPVLIDGRNFLGRDAMIRAGLRYYGMGI
jgi:UDPglucose 6-dehydrogenase